MENLFEDEKEIKDLIDPEQVINIDLDGIAEESKASALEMIDDISKYYYNETFLKEHPAFKKRVDTELESLRIHLKMRKADEVTQDILIKKIAANSDNASMYRALTDIQKTILSITNKIDEIILRLNNMMKGYQLEFNLTTDDDKDNEPKGATMGSKNFIAQMINEQKTEKEPQ